MPKPATSGKSPANARRSARLAAVQALYQMEMNSNTATEVIDQFTGPGGGAAVDFDVTSKADRAFLRDLVQGVADRRISLEESLVPCLSSGWTLERIERLARLILLAAIYELTARPDIPTKVIISEYVDLAAAFFDGPEPGFVNGVLDRLAKQLRPGSAGGGDGAG